MAEAGRGWQRLAEDGRGWQRLAEAGRGRTPTTAHKTRESNA
jgi:hypothetical protein